MLQIKDFAKAEEVIKFINGISANGGADTPEAVHDGLLATTKLSWREETPD